MKILFLHLNEVHKREFRMLILKQFFFVFSILNYVYAWCSKFCYLFFKLVVEIESRIKKNFIQMLILLINHLNCNSMCIAAFATLNVNYSHMQLVGIFFLYFAIKYIHTNAAALNSKLN